VRCALRPSPCPARPQACRPGAFAAPAPRRRHHRRPARRSPMPPRAPTPPDHPCPHLNPSPHYVCCRLPGPAGPAPPAPPRSPSPPPLLAPRHTRLFPPRGAEGPRPAASGGGHSQLRPSPAFLTPAFPCTHPPPRPARRRPRRALRGAAGALRGGPRAHGGRPRWRAAAAPRRPHPHNPTPAEGPRFGRGARPGLSPDAFVPRRQPAAPGRPPIPAARRARARPARRAPPPCSQPRATARALHAQRTSTPHACARVPLPSHPASTAICEPGPQNRARPATPPAGRPRPARAAAPTRSRNPRPLRPPRRAAGVAATAASAKVRAWRRAAPPHAAPLPRLGGPRPP
jgi:hypothetical protein